PPDYTKEIVKNVQTIGTKTGITIAKVFRDILESKHEEDAADRKMIAGLDRRIHQTEVLIRFQKDAPKHHPLVGNDKYLFVHAQDQLEKLRLINYHLDNLINTSLKTISWTKEEREIILKAVNELADSMINAKH